MKRTAQAKLLILSVFVVGVLTGAVLMDVYQTRVLGDDNSSDRRASVRGEVSYAEYLGLSDEQQAEVTVILENTREGFRELRNQTRPQYEQLRENSRNQIRELLTEPQRELHDQWIEDERRLNGNRERRNRDR